MALLEGKSAVVTGGTRGIGKAIAEKLRKKGAIVTVTGTSPRNALPDVNYIAADFSKVAEAERAAAEIARLGVDILVNNAGINYVAPFAEVPLEEFQKVQNVNVTAPFLLCQAVLPHMRARGWGRIVGISSVWGKVSKAGRGPYSTSKFALDGMIAALSAEVAAQGILANCVAPGFVDTELTRRVLGPAGIAAMIAQVPAGRLGSVDEIAEFVAWLAGPENTFISGQNIAIDGGFVRV